MKIIVLWNCMLQLDSTTVSAARMRIKFHCISCLYGYGNKVISYLTEVPKKKNIAHSQCEFVVIVFHFDSLW